MKKTGNPENKEIFFEILERLDKPCIAANIDLKKLYYERKGLDSDGEPFQLDKIHNNICLDDSPKI